MIYFDNLYFETKSLTSSVVNRLYLLTPYEFTLLSNVTTVHSLIQIVLLPYEFTLLSNLDVELTGTLIVLLPYEFTLLSNLFIKGTKK